MAASVVEGLLCPIAIAVYAIVLTLPVWAAVNGGAKLVHPGGAKLVHLTVVIQTRSDSYRF